MDRDQERAIEWDCAQVVNKFYCLLDARNYDDLVNCFVADGVWKRQGNELEGRDAIMAAMQERGDTLVIRHIVTNIQVTIHDENTVSTSEYVTIYRYDSDEKLEGPAPLDGPGVIFLYQDKMTKTDSGWQMTDKRGRPIMLKKKAK
ncbi:MAG: SnoaL-like domain-containing protein [Rhodospirillaceae bacterium]|jgi:hypothetical protein|nr:SnoaL-like domain-containing protein [Rhodospirillaceae bacterium]MBT4938508.1 SnoaL-like domain-containing protein [Rhodospirillaceae bacterium]MBT5941527.1 SnoaL-like domain-containing protein [Rhodospirillaceae bacterium]MBT7268720.1 SnoaL-like domain-containing protein [Rhodospirillaceae bacterium]